MADVPTEPPGMDDRDEPIPLADETFLCSICGKRFTPKGGESTCPSCLHFAPASPGQPIIDLGLDDEGPRCERCGYDLRATPVAGRCPECGAVRRGSRGRGIDPAAVARVAEEEHAKRDADRGKSPLKRPPKLRPPVCDQCGADMRGMPLGSRCPTCAKGTAVAFHPRDTAGYTLMAAGQVRSYSVAMHAIVAFAFALSGGGIVFHHWWNQVFPALTPIDELLRAWSVVIAWGCFALLAVVLWSPTLDPPEISRLERRWKVAAVVAAILTAASLAAYPIIGGVVPFRIGALIDVVTIVAGIVFVAATASRLRAVAAWTGNDPSDGSLLTQAGPTLLATFVVGGCYLFTHFFRRGADASGVYALAIASWLIWRTSVLAWHAFESASSRRVRDARRSRERESGPPVPEPPSTGAELRRRRISSKP